MPQEIVDTIKGFGNGSHKDQPLYVIFDGILDFTPLNVNFDGSLDGEYYLFRVCISEFYDLKRFE
ncbi:MAG: hypothetical protein V4671_18445 [Armatimonadota bacterium]